MFQALDALFLIPSKEGAMFTSNLTTTTILANEVTFLKVS